MQYKNFLTTLAREAGAIIKSNFTFGMKKEWKEDNTPVTLTDTAINELVISRIHDQYPNHGVLGEEADSIIEGAEYVWVCDPVDGTRPFTHGIPLSTFSLALTQNGESIAGVVYDPYLDRMFYAEKGQGAFMNDDPIHVSGKDSFKGEILDIEPFRGDGYDLYPLLVKIADKGAVPLTFASVIYPSALVAVGEVLATVFSAKKPHDGAAIKVIVEEAGGKVTDMFGAEQRYDQPVKGFIASNGKIHDELVTMVREVLEK